MFGIASGVYVRVFLKSIGLGFLLGLLYAFFMLLRRFGFCGRAGVFAQDILYALLCAVLTYLFMFLTTGGAPRLFVFFGEAVGFLTFCLYKAKIRC